MISNPVISNFIECDKVKFMKDIEQLLNKQKELLYKDGYLKNQSVSDDSISGYILSDVHLSYSFNNFKESCLLRFSSKTIFQGITFTFKTKNPVNVIFLFFDKFLKFQRVDIYLHDAGHYANLTTVLDEDLIKILFYSKASPETINKIFPEINEVGVYNFNDSNFKDRLNLLNMFSI